MAEPEKVTIYIHVDADEFIDALDLVMERRNFASPAVRMAIDRVLDPIHDGEVPNDDLRVTWQSRRKDGTLAVHVVPSQALLDLAVPPSEIQDLLRKF